MKHARRITIMALAAVLAAALPPPPLLAQQDSARQQRHRVPRQRRAVQTLPPETLLRLRERLELSDEQVTRLRAFREQAVETRRQEFGERAELRSRLRSGEMTREEYRQQLIDRRQARRAGDDEGARASDVLTEGQREQMSSLRREVARRQMRQRAFQRGRAGVRSGRGMRGVRGQHGMRGARGMRGQRPNRPALRRMGRRHPGSF